MANKRVKHGENCGCDEELSELIGTALTTKLVAETDRAADNTAKELLHLVTDALKIRRELLLDELTHITDETTRNSAASALSMRQTDRLLCTLLKLTASISISTGETMSSYVGHAAQHYETEVAEMVMQPFRDRQAQNIQDAAIAHSGKNN